MIVSPHSSTVWSLMYAAVCTRSDIMHAIGVVNNFFLLVLTKIIGKQSSGSSVILEMATTYA